VRVLERSHQCRQLLLLEREWWLLLKQEWRLLLETAASEAMLAQPLSGLRN
jgi:hypothetical protein